MIFHRTDETTQGEPPCRRSQSSLDFLQGRVENLSLKLELIVGD